MKKKELLVPVGSMEHLPYAIHNGCDAVYLGGKRFGARAYASNFSDEEMIQAIKMCHFYGVKIYVTVNTMVFEREREQFLEYISFLYQNHVDAIIVSDLGLIKDIHSTYPNLEIHVSTQAHTSTLSQIQFLKTLGVTRVVLDRELSLEEINKLPNILEYEVFIHGALCVSFSGECLMSALNEGRSGNRGTCAQYCRMKYRVKQNGKFLDTDGNYLLSTKELNTSSNFSALMNSNITSFKIEGRMKSKEYVGFITKFYRRLMDLEQKVLPSDLYNLQKLFHRDFTNGYLFQNKNIMNFKTSNHIGVKLGTVLEVTRKKIKIRLCEDIHQEDGIKFLPSDKGMIVNYLYNEKGLLVNFIKKNEIAYVDNKIGLQKKEEVYKTIDKLLMNELKHYEEKKIPVVMEVFVSYPTFMIKLFDGKNEVILEEDICEHAKNRVTTKEEIEKQMSRFGSSFFSLQSILISLNDSLFIPVSKMNEIRRRGLALLEERRK